MTRVTFRDASKKPDSDSGIIVGQRLMDAVPPLQAKVRFYRDNWMDDPVGRVVDQIWTISQDNPGDIAVDVLIALE